MVSGYQQDKNNLTRYTRAECRKFEFSGFRQDPILQNFEIWVLGKMVKEVTQAELKINPGAHIDAYCEVFGIDPKDVII